jgi:hypothetical protein
MGNDALVELAVWFNMRFLPVQTHYNFLIKTISKVVSTPSFGLLHLFKRQQTII